MLIQTIHKQEGNTDNQKQAFFPCLQKTRVRRSKREEQKTDV